MCDTKQHTLLQPFYNRSRLFYNRSVPCPTEVVVLEEDGVGGDDQHREVRLLQLEVLDRQRQVRDVRLLRLGVFVQPVAQRYKLNSKSKL
jgi:hypothetical protein